MLCAYININILCIWCLFYFLKIHPEHNQHKLQEWEVGGRWQHHMARSKKQFSTTQITGKGQGLGPVNNHGHVFHRTLANPTQRSATDQNFLKFEIPLIGSRFVNFSQNTPLNSRYNLKCRQKNWNWFRSQVEIIRRWWRGHESVSSSNQTLANIQSVPPWRAPFRLISW